MKKIFAIFLAAVLLAALMSCSANQQVNESSAPQGTAIGVRGEITAQNQNPDGTVTITVAGQKQPDTKYDKASVIASNQTLIQKNGANQTLNSLQVGVHVEVMMEGPVLQSFPVQGAAMFIRILSK